MAPPVIYPVNTTDISPAERVYLQWLTDMATTQDLSQDLGGYVRNVSVAFTAFAILFVGLRFVARHRQAAKIGVDDWLIVASLVLLGGNLIMNIVLVHQGLGRHSGTLTLEDLQTLDKTVVGAEVLYVTAVNMYKLSLLFLYFRIFPLRQVRIGGYICGSVSSGWNLACILAATFQCTPREKLWEPWLEGTCIDLFLTQLCIAIPSILCDIAILCLPIPHVIRLKTNVTQRVVLIFIFLLGSYVVFTSIYRFRIFLLYSKDDIPYTLADGCAWNVIEISSGIVSACLPTMGPIARGVFKSIMPSSAASKGGDSRRKHSVILTIGGTGAKRGMDSTGSKWNRLNESSNESAMLRGDITCDSNDLELVPKKFVGTVGVTVEGANCARRTTGESSSGTKQGDDRASGSDEYPLTVIYQRRDIEWTVEDRIEVRGLHAK